MVRKVKMQVTAITRCHRCRTSGVPYESVEVRFNPMWGDSATLKAVSPLELEMSPADAACFELGAVYELQFLSES